MAQLLSSSKGKEMLTLNGFIYHFHKRTADEKKIWRCQERPNCSGRIHTTDDMIVTTVTAHSHNARPEEQVSFILQLLFENTYIYLGNVITAD